MKSVSRAAFAAAVSIAFACLGAASVFGQETGAGQVVYAEGKEFSVIRAGAKTVYKPDADDVSSIAILAGDMLQTGGATFVEIQLHPSGSVLKVAENSSFLFRKLDGSGGDTSLGLVYGRVRAKVAKLGATETFSIRSNRAVAGVRGTDFGVDSILLPGNAAEGGIPKPQLKVYTFAGEVDVAPQESSKSTIAVKADQQLVLDTSQEIPVVERKALDNEVKDFWKTNSFKGKTDIPAPPEAAIVSTPVAQTGEETLRFSLPDYGPYKKALVDKNARVGVALFFGAIGLVFQGLGASNISGDDYNRGKAYCSVGAAATGISLIALTSSLFVKAKPQSSGGSR